MNNSEPILQNDLSVRTYNCLKDMGINTLNDLTAKTGPELLKCRNFGKKCLGEIEQYLARLNLRLGGDPVIATDFWIDYKKILLPISELCFSVRTYNCLREEKIKIVADLVTKKPVELMRYRNLGKTSLREIEKVLGGMGLRLALQIDKGKIDECIKAGSVIEKEHSAGSAVSFPDCIDYITSAFVDGNSIKIFPDDRRMQRIVESRITESGSRATLEGLGKEFSLTRERIRQLEKKASSMFFAALNLSHRHFIVTFNNEIVQSGNIKAFTYDRAILSSVGFSLFNLALNSINRDIEFNKTFECWVSGNKKNIFYSINNYLRNKCKVGNSYAKHDIDEIINSCISKFKLGSINSNALFHGITSKWFKYVDGLYYYKRISCTNILAGLVRDHYPHGLAIYRDIKSFINLCRAKGLDEYIPKNDRAFISTILRSPDLILWEWGVYIHSANITVDKMLLKSVRNWLVEQFEMGTTRLSVWAAFSKFKEDCERSGINNEHALYSCLKIEYRDEFLFPKDPIVCSIRTKKKLNKGQILEKYLLEKKDAVEIWKIEETLGLKRHQLDTVASDVIVPWGERGNRKLIHISNISFKRSDFELMAKYLVKPIKQYRHISAIKIYQDNYSLCLRNRIPGAFALYSYLAQTLKSKYYFPRYPYILMKDSALESDSRFSFNDLMHDYLKSKKMPVPYAELYTYFVKERGYSDSLIRNVKYLCDRVVTYTQGVFVSLDLLDWTEEKDLILRNLVIEKIAQNIEAGYSFVSLSELLVDRRLPIINKNIDIKWQGVLLRDMLIRLEFLNISDNKKDSLISLCKNDGDGPPDETGWRAVSTNPSIQRHSILGAMIFNKPPKEAHTNPNMPNY